MIPLRSVGSNPRDSACDANACTSFLKQLPPNPTPAFRNLSPIRLSNPTPVATTLTSTLGVNSQMFAISLMREILAARNELLAYFTISAVDGVVLMMDGHSSP